MNRHSTAQENGGSSWTQTNGYDRYGNRTITAGGGQSLTFDTNTNRISGLSYNLAGNLPNDGTHSYAYDVETKIVKVDSVSSYVYDGEGKRVRKLSGENIRMIYGISGELLTAMQNYTYDSLNRIKDASETISSTQTWKQTFTYDRYGNRSFDEGTSGGNYLTTTLTRGCSTSSYNPNGICDKKKVNPIFASTNRISQNQDGTNDYLFDNGGNTTKDPSGNTYIYDAENKQIEVKNSSNQTIGQYWYDGDGKRVKKYVPATGETTILIYDASGKMVAEYSTQVAPVSEAKVNYLTTDHLGSPRINTDANGAVTARHDYQPFGEEISRASYGGDSVRKQFTGYEKDGETKLDFAQARYFNSGFGRFSSPDPLMASARTRSPQTWNRYTYALNNPLKYTDPSGEQVIVQFDETDADGNSTRQYLQYLNGKLYTGTFTSGGKFKRGDEYTGKNATALKILDDLNKLSKIDELKGRLSFLEKSPTIHTVTAGSGASTFASPDDLAWSCGFDSNSDTTYNISKDEGGGNNTFIPLARELLGTAFTLAGGNKNTSGRGAYSINDEYASRRNDNEFGAKRSYSHSRIDALEQENIARSSAKLPLTPIPDEADAPLPGGFGNQPAIPPPLVLPGQPRVIDPCQSIKPNQ